MKSSSEKEILHTFVICAYKESQYLEACVRSALAQKYPSRVVIATSTPNAHIDRIAERYEIPVIVNPEKKGIGYDFDFARLAGDTPLVTVAHQDDCYDPEFSARVIREFREDTLIAFTDYREIDANGDTLPVNVNLRIKKILLFPLRFRCLQPFKLIKRSSIAFGNGICCPSVTFATEKMPKKLFAGKMKSNVDWSAWEILSRKKGRFSYIHEVLMSHRIHDEATTNKMIMENGRTSEDLAMFRRFWPAFIAKPLTRFYRRSEDTVTKR